MGRGAPRGGEWKGGGLFREIDRLRGPAASETRHGDGFYKAIQDAGLSEPTARRWQTIAAVPEGELEAYFAGPVWLRRAAAA